MHTCFPGFPARPGFPSVPFRPGCPSTPCTNKVVWLARKNLLPVKCVARTYIISTVSLHSRSSLLSSPSRQALHKEAIVSTSTQLHKQLLTGLPVLPRGPGGPVGPISPGNPFLPDVPFGPMSPFSP